MFHYLPGVTPLIWLWLAILFFILDFFIASSGFLAWLGVVAALVAVLIWVFPWLGWPQQILIFSMSGIICSVSWWAYLMRQPLRSTKLRKSGDEYIGCIFLLEEPILQGKGVLRIENRKWKIIGPDLPVNAKVRITHVEKSVFFVIKED